MPAMTVGGVLLDRGVVLVLAEEDYLYGVGTVTFRIEEPMGVQDLIDGQWVMVRGHQRLWQGDWVPRLIQVRVAGLARAAHRGAVTGRDPGSEGARPADTSGPSSD